MPREREPNLEDFQNFGRKKKKTSFAITGAPVSIISTPTTIPTITPTITPPPTSIDTNLTSKSVLGETTEAFDEIGIALKSFGASFTGLGNTIKAQSDGLGNQMRTSVNNINTKVSALVQKFKDMGSNLANNLKF